MAGKLSRSDWMQFFIVILALVAFFGITVRTYAEPPEIRVISVTIGEEFDIEEIDWSWAEKEAALKLIQKRLPRQTLEITEKLRDQIWEKAEKYELRPTFVTQVVNCESGFNPHAVSRCGARGLMQIMPKYHKLRDHFDPEENLDYGCRYLRTQLDRFGDEALALAAYNAGPSRVAKLRKVPEIPETQRYVKAVLAGEKKLRGAMNG